MTRLCVFEGLLDLQEGPASWSVPSPWLSGAIATDWFSTSSASNSSSSVSWSQPVKVSTSSVTRELKRRSEWFVVNVSRVMLEVMLASRRFKSNLDRMMLESLSISKVNIILHR